MARQENPQPMGAIPKICRFVSVANEMRAKPTQRVSHLDRSFYCSQLTSTQPSSSFVYLIDTAQKAGIGYN